MTGWKTKAGAIGGICTGIGILIAGLVADPMDPSKLGLGLVTIFGALEFMGIGHKIEKASNGK